MLIIGIINISPGTSSGTSSIVSAQCNENSLFFRCGSVIVDFEMKFNQSAVVSEVLNVLKTAAKEDNFDGFKVDPNSIEQVSLPPTDTSSTKGTRLCLYFYGSLR